MKKRAFTLIEIIMVVVVAAILVVAAMPNQDSLDTQNARDFARKIEGDIAYAQSASIADPVDPIVLIVDLANNKYHLARKSDPTTPIQHPQDKTPYVVTANSGSGGQAMEIVAVDFNGDGKLSFDGQGGLDQDVDAYIQIACGSSKCEVECDSTTGLTSVSIDRYTKNIPANTYASASGTNRATGGESNIRGDDSEYSSAEPTPTEPIEPSEPDGGLSGLVEGLLGGGGGKNK